MIAPAWATCYNAGPLHNKEVECISYVEDNGCYEFNEACVVRFEGMFYLLHTSGCSCPSPEDNTVIVSGPCAKIEDLTFGAGYGDTCAMALKEALVNLP